VNGPVVPLVAYWTRRVPAVAVVQAAIVQALEAMAVAVAMQKLLLARRLVRHLMF
jgi:hypothetical protein